MTDIEIKLTMFLGGVAVLALMLAAMICYTEWGEERRDDP